MLKPTATLQELSEGGFLSPFFKMYEMSNLRAATHEVFHNKWKPKLERSTKYPGYQLFKDTKMSEAYTIHPNQKQMITMIKLRNFRPYVND